MLIGVLPETVVDETGEEVDSDGVEDTEVERELVEGNDDDVDSSNVVVSTANTQNKLLHNSDFT